MTQHLPFRTAGKTTIKRNICPWPQTKQRTMALIVEFKFFSGLIENVAWLSLWERKDENWACCYRWGMRGQWLAQGQRPNEKPWYLAAFILKLLVSSPRSSKPKSKVMRYRARWRTHFLRHVPVYCMDRGRWGTGQPCAGVVVPNRLNDTGNDRAEHADDTSRRDGGQSPLNYIRKTNVKFSISWRGRQKLAGQRVIQNMRTL